MEFIGVGLSPNIMNFLIDKYNEHEMECNSRKFPINTKVHFTGTLEQLAKCTDDLDAAKAVLFDGGNGIVLNSHQLDEGLFYTIDFGTTGYHLHLIPENLLERI